MGLEDLNISRALRAMSGVKIPNPIIWDNSIFLMLSHSPTPPLASAYLNFSGLTSVLPVHYTSL